MSNPMFESEWLPNEAGPSDHEHYGEGREDWHEAPEPVEPPPYCDRCGYYHSDNEPC